jgi:hypothetical protein
MIVRNVKKCVNKEAVKEPRGQKIHSHIAAGFLSKTQRNENFYAPEIPQYFLYTSLSLRT